MENKFNREGVYGTASSRFSLLTLICPEGQIFCSPEQSKLCFELLEILSAAQNDLPSRRGLNTPPKSVFYKNF
jgi:hypothetical protein